jgi:hypothetical protein
MGTVNYIKHKNACFDFKVKEVLVLWIFCAKLSIKLITHYAKKICLIIVQNIQRKGLVIPLH